MELWTNVNIEIKNLETSVPTYYLNALIGHIKELIEHELNNAPDQVVESYENVEIDCKIVKESA